MAAKSSFILRLACDQRYPKLMGRSVFYHAICGPRSRSTAPAAFPSICAPPPKVNLQHRQCSQNSSTNVEHRIAGKKIERMWKMVKSLGDSKVKVTYRDAAALQEAFLFWLSKPVKVMAAKQGKSEIPAQCAQKILDTCVDSGDVRLIEYVVNNPNVSCNAGFDRLQSLYLEPLRGTHSQLREYKQRRRYGLSDNEKLKLLYHASKVRDLAERLQTDPKFSNIHLDANSCEATMNLWSKRCQFFARSSPAWRSKADHSIMFTALGGKTSASQCLSAMHFLIEAWKQNQNGPSPGTMVYSSMLSAIAHSKAENVGAKALALLKEIEKDNSIAKSFHMYTSVLLAFRYESERFPNPAAEEALRLWHHMQLSEDPEIANNMVAASIVMNILAKCSRPEQVQSILDELEGMYDRTGSHPTLIHYNIALNAWAHSLMPDATDQVNNLLARIEALGATREDCKPSIISYTSAMDAYLRSDASGVVEQVAGLLRKLESSQDPRMRPDVVAYERIMRSISVRSSREKDWVIKEKLSMKVQDILLQWRGRARKEKSLCAPNFEAYKMCLHAWSQSHSTLSAENGPRIFRFIEDEFSNGNQSFRPDIEAFEYAMKCLVKRPTGNALDAAVALRAKTSVYGVKESRTLVSLFLRVVSKRDPFRAESILNDMETRFVSGRSPLAPDELCYQAVIRGFALKENGAPHAQRLLLTLTERWEQEGRPELKPGALAYLAVIEAWGKSKDDRALEKVESLFEELSTMTPRLSSFAYSTYQEALTRIAPVGAAQTLEEELETMQRDYESGKNDLARPDSSHFAKLIHAWSMSPDPASPQRAEAILRRMEDLYRHSVDYAHLKPTVSCYVGSIGAWAKSNDPEASDRAITILNDMQSTTLNNHDAAQPNRACFFECMLALTRSDSENKAAKLYELLLNMLDCVKSGNRYAEPDEKIYVLILQACDSAIYSDDDRMARLVIAKQVLQAYIDRNIQLKRKVFLSFLQALKRLTSASERKKIASSVAIAWPKAILDEPRVRNLLDSYERYESINASG